MISRIFYPIGQGAFYAEKHNDFTIVYDCGNWKKTNLSEKVVTQNFTSNDTIDILFISHFDWDHISRIGTLKDTVKEIKCVVLPLLHDDEIILISNIHRVLGYNTHTLINNTQAYFGENVKIIYVKPYEDYTEIEKEIYTIGDFYPDTISSGSSLQLGKANYNWVFVPYNIFNKSRSKDLSTKLKLAGFDVEKLKSEPDYTINKIKNTKEKNKIKKAYSELGGNINQNSMILYSGCLDNPSSRPHIRWYHKDLNGIYDYKCCIIDIPREKVSCIYTGDADLNTIDLKSIFRRFWQNVGTIQVPHHGSIHNFDASISFSDDMVFPISYGKTNTYGHPSYNVINRIAESGGSTLSVTESLESGAIQVIRSNEYK
ncbi:MBL fold metallo-hydrolase [Vibrio harveyi]|uniref:MBL fold metallo-hydrolase n=1 Tax=Vibrio harveyi TaxID=669 RepID=UPI003CFB0FDA